MPRLTHVSGLTFSVGLYSGTVRNTVYSSLFSFIGDSRDLLSKSNFSSKSGVTAVPLCSCPFPFLSRSSLGESSGFEFSFSETGEFGDFLDFLTSSSLLSFCTLLRASSSSLSKDPTSF